jgi:serine/threonine protein phosphatase PrpC/RNA polymerase subunit RPABC4/transcription elongation factor Spt4
MSTHRHALHRYRNACVSLFLGSCGLLLVLQLWTASVAFASTGRMHFVPAITPVPMDQAGAPKDQSFASASVSVVRLLVSYTADGKPVADCTGLGVLVKSLPGNGANDWVLTDGSLVNSSQASCVSGSPTATPSQIQIYFDRRYNSNSQVAFKINSTSTTLVTDSIICSNLLNCNDGPALIKFQGDVAPYVSATSSQIDPTFSPTAVNSGHAIALTKNDITGTIPDANATFVNQNQQVTTTYEQSMPDFLTPQFLSGNSTGLESGTPFIDASGQLTGLHFANSTTSITSAIIASFISDAIKAADTTANNTVNTKWGSGIVAYYQGKYPTAQTNFQQAVVANPRFQGAEDFATLVQKRISSTLTPTPVSQQGGTGVVIPGTSISIPLLQLSLIVLVLLVLLVLLTSLISRSRTQRRRAFKAEIDEADRQAAAEAQQIKAMETAQQTWAQHNQASELPTAPVPQQATVVRQSVADLHCPRCGELVAHDANYCPNCRLALSPSESGMHLRIHPSTSAAPVANANARIIPPTPASMIPAGSFVDQPTIPQAPPPPLSSLVVPTDAVTEHPTVEMAPEVTWKKGKGVSDEKTLPFPMQQVRGKRLGFVVGTRSDPGIKRKHKPNEDSLLAAQGLISSTPGPQPFGLFVIADGMGGHANGQDASRLAIQTIIETTLPKLVNNAAESIDYAQILVDGIQSANQAVHQQNMDKRGDMGTTVTSALVVGSVAYVANVGDSRTYLYRESEGLQKVTNDHSVVASLVEAGIIKPDDIYTHPKRNQIYRSLGEKANVEVDVFTVQLHEGDKLMLCSDGLWDMVRDPKIEEVIKHPAPDPAKTGDALIKSALEGGGEDNVSVIVVQITEGGNPEALPRVQLLAKPDSVKMPQF